jgi:hypothetical protein
MKRIFDDPENGESAAGHLLTTIETSAPMLAQSGA